MNSPSPRLTPRHQPFRVIIVLICVASLSLGVPPLPGQLTTEEPAPKIANETLDALVAPIALYPDPLLAQTLAASTYPLELIQLQQWMANNKHLKDQALADAVEKQPWDPSVQAMAAFPDVVKLLGDNVAWSMDLGNAFLAQPADVMDAVQRMRGKAESKGNLESGPQQTVETQTVEGEQVILIEPADPETVYVPSYNPTLVYGDAAYAYPMYYPPPGYYATGAALAFGVGVALGAAWGGGWGYNCGWEKGDLDINYNNKYLKNSNRNNNISSNQPSQPGGGKWQHNPQHRGGAPYGDKGTASRYGGRSRSQPIGAAAINRASSGIGAGNAAINRSGANVGMNRSAGLSRPGSSNPGANRPGSGSRLGGADTGIRPNAVGSGFSGGDRIGSRSVSPGSGYGSNRDAFDSGGFSGNALRASSSRGHNSFGSSGGASFSGGRSGGGGFRGGGGGRGGGGRRR
jgi:Protein of unknown function (DUF3300)